LCIFFVGCTISEKTTVHVIAPETEDILVYPFVEAFSETNAIIIWQIKDGVIGHLDFKTKNEKTEIFTASVTDTIFRVVITNLTPNAEYFYRIAGTSDKFSTFKTLSPERKNYSFGVLGDNRTRPDEFKKVVAEIIKHDMDFVIHTGDLLTKGTKLDEWYSQWFTPGRPLLEKAPVIIAWGNHEHPWDEKSYLNVFYPDRSQFKSKGYFSFQNGNVLFIHINTYEPFKPGTEQYVWLEEKLKTCKLPFIVAALHVAAFTGAGHTKGGDVKDVRKFVVPLLGKYNVSLVVSGHDHVYDRSKYAETTYVISGGAGAPLYDPKTYLNPFSVKAKKSLNYMIFSPSVSNITANAYDIEGNVIDSFSLSPRKIPKVIPQAFATFRPPWHDKFKFKSLDWDIYVSKFTTDILKGSVKVDVSENIQILPSANFSFELGSNEPIKELHFKAKLISEKEKDYPIKVTVAIAGFTNSMEFIIKE